MFILFVSYFKAIKAVWWWLDVSTLQLDQSRQGLYVGCGTSENNIEIIYMFTEL